MIQLITSSLSEKDIIKAPKSKVPVIFLGGYTEDNDWREEVKKEFGEDLNLLDPFDKKYNPEDDTYKELAGMINSGYVIFYKGGKRSDKEKNFLDLIGRRDNTIKEFDDLESLKKFLRKIKEVKLENISTKIRKCAQVLMKTAIPYMQSGTLKNYSKALDFHFEKLDNESVKKVIKDIFEGKTIQVPVINGGNVSYVPFNINEVVLFNPEKPEELDFLKQYLKEGVIDRHFPAHRKSVIFYYDEALHKYNLIEEAALAGSPVVPVGMQGKFAKEGVVYDSSCTKVNIPDDIADSIMKWGHDNIPEDKLYVEDKIAKGREDDIHVTVLYGIKDSSPSKTATVIGNTEPFEVRLGLINAFKDNKKYDVIKIEVESGDLEKLHYDLEGKIDNDNTFPTYKPHVTIAYVQKGAGDHLIGDETFKGKTFKVNNIEFSGGNDGVKKKLPLGV